MGPVNVVARQKRLGLAVQAGYGVGLVLEPTQTLVARAHRAVETLNGSLLVLLIRTRDPVARAVVAYRLSERSLELRSAIGLHHLDETRREAPGHARTQKGIPLLARQLRR